ncbi:MAG: FKBP-type peptidyl-prolyl cis-trans isomerase [Acidobacteria bacterium]|nr:MAG: FKBP-type peptidyl-prolyl cis-trans isomerase [Acidobacteriota bacterium]
MRRHSPIVLLALIALIACGGESDAQSAAPAAEEPAAAAGDAAAGDDFANDDQRAIYAIGVFLAQQASQQIGPFYLSEDEKELVLDGFRDGLLGNEPRVSLQEYGPKVQALMQARSSQASAAEKTASAAFVEKMKSEPGAETSESGLVFIPIVEGTGASPGASDKVKVHYHGTLRDGTVFDSSVERGQPIELGLNQVIPCWTEGMQKMKVGGKAKLICPSDIAYGDQGRPPSIPGGATLVFEVELIDVVDNQ